jgi:hypothetical protein
MAVRRTRARRRKDLTRVCPLRAGANTTEIGNRLSDLFGVGGPNPPRLSPLLCSGLADEKMRANSQERDGVSEDEASTTSDPAAAAESVGLVYVSDEEPGIRRLKSGKSSRNPKRLPRRRRPSVLQKEVEKELREDLATWNRHSIGPSYIFFIRRLAISNTSPGS